MFYVYCKKLYYEYEPAEGGYYVSCHKIADCEEYVYLEDALKAYADARQEAEDLGFTLQESFGDTVELCKLGEKTSIICPWARYDDFSDGIELGIEVDKPKDALYEGYC